MKKIILSLVLLVSISSYGVENQLGKKLQGNLIDNAGEVIKADLSVKKHLVLYWSTAS